jgi:hypothetical protein
MTWNIAPEIHVPLIYFASMNMTIVIRCCKNMEKCRYSIQEIAGEK